jgi:thiol:disulfide interchange protein
MKKIYLLLIMIAATVISNAQILKPVKWSFSSKQTSDSTAQIQFSAKIDKKWHLYSLNAGEGPRSLEITVNKGKEYKLLGKVKESKPEEQFDENFGAVVRYFELKANFTQDVALLKNKPSKVTGSLEFMCCDDKQCLPPDVIEFEIDIPARKGTTPTVIQPEIKSNVTPVTTVTDTGMIMKDSVSDQKTEIKSAMPVAENKKNEKPLSLIFIAAFLGGFLALLTPCVFPMIPLTVTFFTKRSKTKAEGIRNALIYGLSIIFIYVTVGFLVTKIFGSDALNELASSAVFNLLFFIVFIVFAISFLGAFEITLPASWVNKSDAAADKGGLIGIFFMAFTLSLVSFSCTGPIIGSLLVQAAIYDGNIGPIVGMAGFSLALALPFALFAAFPGWLNSIPKSGGWLNSVKVVLGLLELALALKFLSNVDLAYHWGFLKREVFLSLWIIIFSTIGFYLLGKITLSHDSPVTHLSIPRLLLAIVTFSFVIYLIPGLWGAPLRIISGFPPPIQYNEGWNLSSGTMASSRIPCDIPEGVHPEECPHNLNCFHDYDLALAYARKVKKPLFVDFTGYSCVNCRKMEDNVWSDSRALELLRDKVVLVSLYVDDKKELPAEQQYTSATTGKKVKTIGNKWSDMQAINYGTNSQPYYVILDGNEKPLNGTSAFDTNVDNFIGFINGGLKAFK